MANSEWVLGAHVQHFENLYNIEIRDGIYYCCCDISHLDMPCVKNFADLDITACTSECEPFFDIYFRVCFVNGTCSKMKNEIAYISNTPSTWISPLLLQLQSNEFVIDNITNVSVNEAWLNYTCYMFM